jgi:pimeloyl-ACP methyl ester carboxylesterase
VELLVLLNAMVPAPHESAGDWWAATGQAAARAQRAVRDGRRADAPFDVVEDFFNDVPAELVAEAMAMGEPAQSTTPFGPPWPLDRWPNVPTRFLQGRDDRLFPLDFQRRVVAERLGLEVDDMPGGHLLALAYPVELAERLETYRRRLTNTG